MHRVYCDWWLFVWHHLTCTGWLVLVSCTVITLAPGRCASYWKSIIFNLTISKCSLGICCEIALRWIPEYLSDEKSTLLQVMPCGRQVINHYLLQWRPDLCRHMASVGHNGLNWISTNERYLTVPSMGVFYYTWRGRMSFRDVYFRGRNSYSG